MTRATIPCVCPAPAWGHWLPNVGLSVVVAYDDTHLHGLSSYTP